jgi:predicted outer membrane protein
MRTLAAALVVGGIAGLPGHAAQAQPSPVATAAISGENFLGAAHSSAMLQARAADLAASRETRPEVRPFARRMVEFRRDHIPKLEAAAREHRFPTPSGKQFEHQVLIENLEPLDFLALSRRYAELQVQALEQELQIYAAAANSPDPWAKSLAAETTPQLTKLLEEARRVQQAVGP